MSGAPRHLPESFEHLLEQQKVHLRRGKIDPKVLARLVTEMNRLDVHDALRHEALWPDKYTWLFGKRHWLDAIYQSPETIAHRLFYNSRYLPRVPWLARMLAKGYVQPLHVIERERRLLTKHPDLAFVFIRHPNGYLRESGLKAIGETPVSPFVLATVFYRLNDWVAPVRIAAGATISRLAESTSIDIIAAVAPAIASNSEHWGRSAVHRELFVEMLEKPGVISAIVALLCAGQVKGSTALLNTLMASPSVDAWLPVLSQEAQAPAVRAMAFKALIQGLARWRTGREIEIIDRYTGKRAFRYTYAERPLTNYTAREIAIRNAGSDRAASVRKLAADSIIAGLVAPDLADSLIMRLKVDPSSTVRSRIEFVIRNRGATV
jgi:hypothetical protein